MLVRNVWHSDVAEHKGVGCHHNLQAARTVTTAA